MNANTGGAPATSMIEEWQAIRWTSHAAVTVVVDDATTITGRRVIAECETEEDARLIAATPNMKRALAALLKRTSMDYYPVEQEMARSALAKAEGGAS